MRSARAASERTELRANPTPAAIRYASAGSDSLDHCVGKSSGSDYVVKLVLAGMAVMGTSLILFGLDGGHSH